MDVVLITVTDRVFDYVAIGDGLDQVLLPAWAGLFELVELYRRNGLLWHGSLAASSTVLIEIFLNGELEKGDLVCYLSIEGG